MDIRETEAILEAILFASGEPVSSIRMADALDIDADTVRNILTRLSDQYDYDMRGLRLVRLDDSWQMCSRPKYAEHIRCALDTRREYALSGAAMEVLAIIAFNQPVTRLYVDQIRRVDSSGVLSTLVDRGLIEEQGTLDVPGRPKLYGTTKDFLRCFCLSSIDELRAETSDQSFFDQDGHPVYKMLETDGGTETAAASAAEN